MIKKGTCDRCGKKAVLHWGQTDNEQVIWVCDECAKDNGKARERSQ